MKRLLAFTLLMGIAGVLWLAVSVFLPAGPHEQRFLTVKSGASMRQVARDLEAQGLVRNALALRILHYFEKRTVKAGEYAFDHPASALEVYDRLARGDVYFHPVVIPEGFNVFDIARALDEAHICPEKEFLELALHTHDLVSDLDPQARSLEGFLFPDTYNFGRSQTPREIAAEMVRRFRKEAAALNLAGRPDLHRVVTLASIVEKETSIPAERPLVAGVFENRIKSNIGLATDPSVIYASLLAGKFDGTIRQSDLALDSPYNTYRYRGLPPGPIANPGYEALQAALHPTTSAYLYFVANNKGGHNFAKTLEGHNRNVAAYRNGVK